MGTTGEEDRREGGREEVRLKVCTGREKRGEMERRGGGQGNRREEVSVSVCVYSEEKRWKKRAAECVQAGKEVKDARACIRS